MLANGAAVARIWARTDRPAGPDGDMTLGPLAVQHHPLDFLLAPPGDRDVIGACAQPLGRFEEPGTLSLRENRQQHLFLPVGRGGCPSPAGVGVTERAGRRSASRLRGWSAQSRFCRTSP